MGSFDSNSKKKDEYDLIYDYDAEYLDYDDEDEEIEKIRYTIGRGDCLYCGAKNAMEYEGTICFICSSCGKSVHEEIYYRWAAGYTVVFED